MQIYLVGGAVRDRLLRLPVIERDWVVVGCTAEHMLAQGYKPVGKDFPVFLHPETHEEYALARTERKVAPGYHGFVFHASPDVSLEEDLKRRDLTINAIAMDADHNLVDPFNGRKDLNERCFRHVSAAFSEDPVRILRLARFAARFHDFSIHADTLSLMRRMVNEGEVATLVAERVWKEWSKALLEIAPWRFFEVLKSIGALSVCFPEWTTLPNRFALRHAAAIDASLPIRLAICCQGLSKKDIRQVCKRYRVPKACAEMAELGLLLPSYLDCWRHQNVDTVYQCLSALDVWRRPGRFASFQLLARLCCHEHKLVHDRAMLALVEDILEIDTQAWQDANLPGHEFAQRLADKRRELIAEALQNWPQA